MDEKEAIRQIESLAKEFSGDTETCHIRVDDVITGFLRANGFENLADAYDIAASEVGFWYA